MSGQFAGELAPRCCSYLFSFVGSDCAAAFWFRIVSNRSNKKVQALFIDEGSLNFLSLIVRVLVVLCLGA